MTPAAIAELLRPLCDLGHAVGPCDRCGLPVITGKGDAPACRMTPGCTGHHRTPTSRKEK